MLLWMCAFCSRRWPIHSRGFALWLPRFILKKKATSADRRKERQAKTVTSAVNEKPVTLTLKIDSKTYIRLSTLRAKERRTAPDILTEALQEYLERAGA
jgi:hypothetical protein